MTLNSPLRRNDESIKLACTNVLLSDHHRDHGRARPPCRDCASVCDWHGHHRDQGGDWPEAVVQASRSENAENVCLTNVSENATKAEYCGARR